MPRYLNPVGEDRIVLPSDPSGKTVIHSVGRIGFDEETDVMSRSQRTELVNVGGVPTPIAVQDGAQLNYQLYHHCLTHPETSWNLEDEEGKVYERNEENLNFLIRREDRQHIIEHLAEHHFPEMFAERAKALEALEQERLKTGYAAQGESPLEPSANPLPDSSVRNSEIFGSNITPEVTPLTAVPLASTRS